MDIAEAAHFYEWMRSVVGGALFAGQSNLDTSRASPGQKLPGMDVVSARADSAGLPSQRGATIITPYGCYLKQLRVRTIRCPEEPRRWCVPEFSNDVEEKKPRVDAGLRERYRSDEFKNEAGALTNSLDYVGFISGLSYPGEGGFAPAVTTVRLPVDGHMRAQSLARLEPVHSASGFWPGHWAYCADVYSVWETNTMANSSQSAPPVKQRYNASDCLAHGRGNAYTLTTFQADINRFERERWIDGKTALVHLTCSFYNRNINMNATIRYNLEFTNAGLTRPYSPFMWITKKIDTTRFDPVHDVSLVVVFGMWSFMENLLIESYDDNLRTGPGHGALREGWSWWLPNLPRGHVDNVLDLGIMLVAMKFYWCQCAAHGR